MKKANSRGSKPKATRAPKSVDEYIASIPEPARSTVSQIRAAIRSAVPAEATEAISYGIPAFKHNGVLVWFAAFKSHCSFFPTASVIKTFKGELEGFSTSKGTIHFPIDELLPIALIKRMVKARVAENEKKKRH